MEKHCALGEKKLEKENIFKQKNIIVALLVIVGGVLLLFYGTSDLPLSGFASEIGSILMISGVYTIIESYYLERSLVDMVIDKVSLDKNIDEKGLIKLGDTLSEISYSEYFKKANSNIDIVHIYARTWTNNNYDFIKKAVMNTQCTLRIILLNPNSKFVPALEEHFGYKEGDLVKLITEVSDKWKELHKDVTLKKEVFTNKKLRRQRKNYDSKHYGKVELYYYNGQPSNSLYRIDDKMIVVEAKTSNIKSINLPYFVYENRNNLSMYKVYLNEIENIISESNKVELI